MKCLEFPLAQYKGKVIKLLLVPGEEVVSQSALPHPHLVAKLFLEESQQFWPIFGPHAANCIRTTLALVFRMSMDLHVMSSRSMDLIFRRDTV